MYKQNVSTFCGDVGAGAEHEKGKLKLWHMEKKIKHYEVFFNRIKYI